MTISFIDRSNYYKGLLILTGRDRIIDPRERELMMHFGKLLDFDRKFCEAAIDDLLGNAYLTNEPAVFSSREIAECFLRDSILLATIDGEMHPEELSWLKAIACSNGLPREWLDEQIEQLREQKNKVDIVASLEIQQLI